MASAAFSFTGAAGSLLRLDASAATSVVATLDDLSGVTSVVWSVAGTDETGGTYTLVASGPSGSVCTFTSGAAGTAGLLQCTINGGVNPATGDVDLTMTKKAKWQVKTAAGYDIGVVGEELEHNPTYGSTVIVNNIARNMLASASTFADNVFRVYGSSDATKLVALEVDGLTTGTTRTVTIPDKNGTLAMTSDIVGPTFADNVFRITGSADTSKLAAFEVDGFTTATTRTFTLPNADATVSCLSVAERYTGAKTFDDSTCILAGSSSGQVTLKAAASGGSVVATFKASSGTVMYTSDLGTVDDSVFVVQDDGDATKQLAFQCSGITTGNKRTLTAPDASGTITCDGVASTFSAAKTFADAMCILAGSTSGTTTLKANATAGTTTATFQAASGTVAYLTDATAQYDNVLFKQIADAAATTTTAATTFYYFGYARTITALYWLPRGTSTQDATNYATILVERYNSSNVLQGTVATRSTTPADGGTITGGVPYSLGAITNASVSAGDYLKITISKPGTGVSLASAEVCVVC